MPAHNEAGRIASNIEETAKTFNEFGCDWEIILIDDGSEDNTYEIAKSLIAKYPERLIVKKNRFNLGKGRAIKKALHYVSGNYILFLDADLDLHPIQFQTLFDIMRLNNADVVIGSKLHPNSVVIYPWHRRIICLVYFCLIKLLFGLPCRDTQTGLKLFKTDALRKVLPRLLVRRFAFDIELLVNISRLGYKIVDAPLAYLPQKRFGWINLRAIVKTGLDTLAVFIRARVLKYYDRIDYYRHKNLAKEFRRMRK
ncbi:MAG: glycosyltransferase [Candidatus Omnitrophica bacterium]|nr:glycosyltransferase [Candidatus Omnitrophota bacterium]